MGIRSARIETLVVAVALALALTGCSSTPTPTPAASHGCTPSKAKTTFGTPVQGKKEPVEAHLMSFDGGVMISTPIQTPTDTGATFSYSGDSALSDLSSASESDWQSMVLSRVRKTGKVPSGFGNGAQVQPSDITPVGSSGTFVVVTEEELTTVPFTVSCSGGTTVVGSVAAVAETGSYSMITQCGAPTDGVPSEIVALMGPACSKE